jgi:hypothetical protein
MQLPRPGKIWIDPLAPAAATRAREPRGYSAGEAETPPMGAIVGIGIVAVAAALLLGKLGAT